MTPDQQTANHALVVTGAPGSGKSTLGRLLAQRLGAVLLDLDTATADLTAIIADLLGTHDLDDPLLAKATREARYATITALAEENLRLGISAVLVAPFTAERRDPPAWAALHRRLQAAGGVPSLVWLAIRGDVVAQRVSRRGAGRDLPKLTRADRLAGIDLAPPQVPHIRAEASRPPEMIAEDVLALLPRRPGSEEWAP
jgi:predicted kinase